MASWHLGRGYQVAAEEQAKTAAKYGPRRFWMKEGSSKTVAFIDGDDPFCVREHNPKINGEFGDPFTCLSDEDNGNPYCCDKCGRDYYPYLAGFSTVVNMSEWVDSKGAKHSYELELYAAKSRTMTLFKTKKEKWGQISGQIVEISRTDAKSPNVGNDFEKVKLVSDQDKLFAATHYKGHKLSDLWDKAEASPEIMANLRKTFLVEPDQNGKLPRRVPPFNYLEILKPKTLDEVKKLLSGLSAADKQEKVQSSGGVKTDDIPF